MRDNIYLHKNFHNNEGENPSSKDFIYNNKIQARIISLSQHIRNHIISSINDLALEKLRGRGKKPHNRKDLIYHFKLTSRESLTFPVSSLVHIVGQEGFKLGKKFYFKVCHSYSNNS
jgi:hypothetical protein